METSTGHADAVSSSLHNFEYNWPFDYPFMPLQLINISSSWAELFKPRIEDQDTGLSNFLMQQIVGPGLEAALAQNIIVMFTVNDLARTSWDSVFQDDVQTVG